MPCPALPCPALPCCDAAIDVNPRSLYLQVDDSDPDGMIDPFEFYKYMMRMMTKMVKEESIPAGPDVGPGEASL